MSVSHVQRLLLRHRHKQLRAIMMECRVQFCYGSDGFVRPRTLLHCMDVDRRLCSRGATLQPKYGIYCVDRWREDALKEQELETEKWIFSFQEAAQQQRLLDSVSEQAAVAPLPEQHFLP